MYFFLHLKKKHLLSLEFLCFSKQIIIVLLLNNKKTLQMIQNYLSSIEKM